MKLQLYSSIGKSEPNLLSVQASDLDVLPTVLVCPFRENQTETKVRSRVLWNGKNYIAMCDLVRPIRRHALRLVGELDPETSQIVMEKFRTLLAR